MVLKEQLEISMLKHNRIFMDIQLDQTRPNFIVSLTIALTNLQL